jgi:hypothetical protein
MFYWAKTDKYIQLKIGISQNIITNAQKDGKKGAHQVPHSLT